MAVVKMVIVAALLAGCTGTRGDVLVSLDGVDGGVDGDARGVDGAASDATTACSQPPACPTSAAFGTITVCGRIIDLATSQPLPNDGVISVGFFNYIDFGGGAELANVEPDECGWFVAENIFGVLPGFVVMSADDDIIGGGDYVRVVSVLQTELGQVVRANAYALRAEREEIWSTSAGLGAGNGFEEVGALLPIFIDRSQGPAGTPVAGVTITLDDGTPIPEGDYYFGAGGAIQRDSVDPAAPVTGVDGAGLLLGAIVTNEYTGQKNGCTFPEVNGLLFGVIQAQELVGTCAP